MTRDRSRDTRPQEPPSTRIVTCNGCRTRVIPRSPEGCCPACGMLIGRASIADEEATRDRFIRASPRSEDSRKPRNQRKHLMLFSTIAIVIVPCLALIVTHGLLIPFASTSVVVGLLILVWFLARRLRRLSRKLEAYISLGIGLLCFPVIGDALICFPIWFLSPVTTSVSSVLRFAIAEALSLGLLFYTACCFSRFLMRVAPMYPDGSRRMGCLVGIGLIVFSALLCSLVGMRMHRRNADSSSSASILESLTLLFFPMLTAYLIRRRLRDAPRALERGFVLFLRRFGSVADRTLVAALHRAMPPSHACVFIQGPPKGASYYDPIVWGLAGLRWSHPLSGCPIGMIADEESWPKTVACLAHRAGAIVFDATNDSSSIETEKKIIQDACADDRTIWLISSGSMANRRVGHHVVEYETNWISAIPRILAALGLFSLLALPGLEHLATGSLPPSGRIQEAGLMIVSLVGSVVLSLFLTVTMIVRPEASARSRRALQRSLSDLIGMYDVGGVVESETKKQE